ncbi:retrovirus-related pol polyprotein LINE-1 [Tanacetum coccineum]
MEKYRERQKDLHLAFLDLEKAYNSVPRELIWNTLRDKGTPMKYIKVIQDMYDIGRGRTCERTPTGIQSLSPVDVGLTPRPQLYLARYLFALILDVLSRGIQESIPWCLIFADDIVLVSDTRDGLNGRLENENDQNEEAVIRIGKHILEPKESFRYLGSVIHKSGRIEDDVTHRIQAGWLKWAVLRKRGYDGAVADIWSCGVILYVLLTGYLPFEESDLATLYKKVNAAEFSYPFWFPSGAKSLIDRILDTNPETNT